MYFSLKTIAYLCGILFLAGIAVDIGFSIYYFLTEEWASDPEYLLRTLAANLPELAASVFFFVFAKRM